MTRFLFIALPFAFLLGACDTPDATPNDDAVEVNEAEVRGEPGHRGRGKLARLDADKDGALSLAEAQGHPRLAEKFTEIDTNSDGKLTEDELAAMKGKHGKHGKHGRGRGHGPKHGGKHGDKDGGWHDKSPAERAAHKLAKYDANGDKVLTADEVKDSRFADKFAEIDTDKDGKLTHDELTAAKARHGDRHGDKQRHGKRGDHDGKGWQTRSPAERADKIFAKFDANADAVISRDEIAGRKFADKFAAADSDADGKLTRDELIAFKPAHDRRADAPAVR